MAENQDAAGNPSLKERVESLSAYLGNYSLSGDSLASLVRSTRESRLKNKTATNNRLEVDTINPGLCQTIEADLESGHVVLLTGAKRIGKTSVLYAVAQDVGFGYDTVGNRPEQMAGIPTNTFEHVIKTCIEKHLPVIIDEFAFCAEKPDKLALVLAAAKAGVPMLLDVPVTEMPRIEILFRDEGVHCDSEIMRLLGNHEMTTFLSEVLSVPPSDKLVNLIQSLSGGSLCVAKSILAHLPWMNGPINTQAIVNSILGAAESLSEDFTDWDKQKAQTPSNRPDLISSIPNPPLRKLLAVK